MHIGQLSFQIKHDNLIKRETFYSCFLMLVKLKIIFLVVFGFLGIITIHIADAQNSTINDLKKNLNELDVKLTDHENRSTLESLYGIEIALIALGISLGVSVFAAIQADRNTKNTKNTITKDCTFQ